MATWAITWDYLNEQQWKYLDYSHGIVHDGAQWNIAAFHLLVRMFLIKDGTQKTTHLAIFQAVVLVLDALDNK